LWGAAGEFQSFCCRPPRDQSRFALAGRLLVFQRLPVYIIGVALFKRILVIPRTLLARFRDERSQRRHRVGADFPLLARVEFSGINSASRETIRDFDSAWQGRVRDVSAFGLSVPLPPDATAARNEAVTVRLDLEGRLLVIPGTVAHFRRGSLQAQCGLRLEFSDFAQQLFWHQIVEAVGLGASFTPVVGRRAPRPALGLARRQWTSLRQTRLTEWRETGTRKLDRFELRLEDHEIEGRVADANLTILSLAARDRSPPAAVDTEVRQLVFWVAANLPPSVPADLKEFMQRAANAPDAPPKRAR
jgi:hypothetical protein